MIDTYVQPSPSNAPRRDRQVLLHFPVIAVVATCFGLAMYLSLGHWNWFEYGVLRGLNSLSHRSVFVDDVINATTRVTFSNLLIVSLVWYAWFNRNHVRSRAALMTGSFFTVIAGLISRVLQHVLPTHLRPLLDPALHFLPPHVIDTGGLNKWSSFPSDHAVIWFGLAATISIVDTRTGRLAYISAIVLGVFRTYLGYHYPTDMIGGAMLGILAVELTRGLSPLLIRPLLTPFADRYRPALYAASFAFCFCLTQLFTDLRESGKGLLNLFRHLH